MDELAFKETSRAASYLELMKLRIGEHYVKDVVSREELTVLPRLQEGPVVC